MSVFKVGKATVTRIEETYLPIYPVTDIFPAVTEAQLAEHAHWLAPHHYDPVSQDQAERAQLAAAARRPQNPDRRLLRQPEIAAAAASLEHARHAVARPPRRGRRAARRDRSGDVHAPASRPCRLEHP